MNENLLLFGAAGVIILIFGVIVFFAIQATIKPDIEFEPEKQKIPGFNQMRELRDELKEQVKKNEVVENLEGIIANSSAALKKKVNNDSENFDSTLPSNATKVNP